MNNRNKAATWPRLQGLKAWHRAGGLSRGLVHACTHSVVLQTSSKVPQWGLPQHRAGPGVRVRSSRRQNPDSPLATCE